MKILHTIKDDKVNLKIEGSIDEHAEQDLFALKSKTDNRHVVLDLSGLTHVNSIGLVSLVGFLKSLPIGTRILKLSNAAVNATLVIPGIFKNFAIESVEGVFECEACESEFMCYCSTAEASEEQCCPKCKGPATLHEEFAAFIEDL